MQTIEKRTIHCVGCGQMIPWDGTGLFAYTCRCGATLFADSNGNLIPPASLVLAIVGKRELPHIDYYIGYSNYVSIEKQKVYDELRQLGAKWSWECEHCKDHFLERKRMELKEGLLHIELHLDLKKLL